MSKGILHFLCHSIDNSLKVTKHEERNTLELNHF